MTHILFICIIIILFFFCLYFFLENEKLKKKVLELEEQTKEILERKLSNVSNVDQISINTISTNLKEEIPVNKTVKKVETKIYKSEQKEKIEHTTTKIQKKQTINSQPKKELNSKNKLYQKNTISNNYNVTSPVSITNKDTYIKPKETFDMNKLTLDLNEFIKKSEKVVPKIAEKPKTTDYLKEISDKMAEELKPQTIELTDYEKAQEEHAIISYKELLALKDKLTMYDDEEGTVDFIEELKRLRNGLTQKEE